MMVYSYLKGALMWANNFVFVISHGNSFDSIHEQWEEGDSDHSWLKGGLTEGAKSHIYQSCWNQLLHLQGDSQVKVLGSQCG